MVSTTMAMLAVASQLSTASWRVMTNRPMMSTQWHKDLQHQRYYAERAGGMLAASPFPVTRPMRALTVWMPTIIGNVKNTVHRIA